MLSALYIVSDVIVRVAGTKVTESSAAAAAAAATHLVDES